MLKTKLITNPTRADFSIAAGIIREGGLVAFPTETVYGLGGNALLSDAAKKIYAAKGRPSDNPLIIHLADAADAERYCETNPLFYRLAAAFMPGPLTMILRKKPCIPDEVTGGLPTVAVRIPSDPVAHAFLSACGLPVAAPSANLSGKPSPTKAEHVMRDLYGRIDIILDGGDSEIGLESTIVKIDDGGITLLRPGAVTPEMLRKICPELTFDDKSMRPLAEGEKPLAPGMKYRHYAPAAKLILLDGDREAILAYMKTKIDDPTVGFLSDGEDVSSLVPAERCFPLSSSKNEREIAARLFAALREIDDHPAIQTVYAPLPDTEGIGLAVYNRLVKAAGFTVISL